VLSPYPLGYGEGEKVLIIHYLAYSLQENYWGIGWGEWGRIAGAKLLGCYSNGMKIFAGYKNVGTGGGRGIVL